ncbi:class I SAM-dependent methyltransferase [Aerosakkonemataceae cyanobacterium BLCC-F154]|uniref:Class I SAM-dependent methyltransferase n=1 Tax=Floridaenema fluviatile BLCC-F154 TaxID=3153640 RepID=A0ABV4YJE9_9CYAN
MSFDFSNPKELVTNPLSYFCNVGEDYEKYRPLYPEAAIDKILSGLPSPNQLLAADIGAGTGISSRLLANRGVRVFAIEPNPDMFLAAKPHERVKFLTGTAEKIPLETASVDLVISFQAFHWFDFIKSLAEFHRILKPGGRVALMWNFWQQTDVISQAYTKLLFAAGSDRQNQTSSSSQIKTLLQSLQYQLFWQGLWLPYFKNLRCHSFTFEQHLDLVGLVGLARSQGFTPQEGTALAELILKLGEFCDRFSDNQGQVRLVYLTKLYIATSA